MKLKIILFFIYYICNTIFTNGQNLYSKRIPIQQGSYGNPNFYLKNNKGFLVSTLLDQNSQVPWSYINNINPPYDSSITIIAANTPIATYSLLLTTPVETADKGLLIGGGYDSISNDYGNNYNFLLLKIDSTFHFEWAKVFYSGSFHTGLLNSVTKLHDGGFLFNGMIKTDSVGNLIWQRYSSIQSSILLSDFSNIITAGSNSLIKLDSLNNGIWAKKLFNKSISCGTKTLDNGFAVCGSTDSASYKAMFFLKTDSSGNLTSFYRSDYSNWNSPNDIIQLADSDFVLTTSDNSDIFLIRIDKNGILKSSKYWNQLPPISSYRNPRKMFNKTDTVFTICADYNSQFYNSIDFLLIDIDINDSTTCGNRPLGITWVTDTISILPDTIYNSNPANFTIINMSLSVYTGQRWITDFCSISNYIDPLNKLKQVIIYPNPSSGRFSISSDYDIKNLTVEITDQYGRLIFNKYFNFTTTENIDMNFEPGIYFITLINSESKIVKKLIVSN